MNTFGKVFVTGHKGMVGTAILKELKKNNYKNILVASKKDLDLRDQNNLDVWFNKKKPTTVILSAAKVGGINSNNKYPAEFIYDNLMIQSNIIKSAHKYKVKKLLFIGSSCIYPRKTKIPIKENQLLSGQLEKTNYAYAIAKIAGLKMCEAFRDQYNCDFRSIMPTNLYGPGDNYALENSHVIPAIIKKLHQAKKQNKKKVYLWGDGSPKREFLFSEDFAKICLKILSLSKIRWRKNLNSNVSHINIGTGEEVSIKKLSQIINKVVGYNGQIVFSDNGLNGTPRKLLDISLMKKIGLKHSTNLKDGIIKSYRDFLNNYEK